MHGALEQWEGLGVVPVEVLSSPHWMHGRESAAVAPSPQRPQSQDTLRSWSEAPEESLGLRDAAMLVAIHKTLI